MRSMTASLVRVALWGRKRAARARVLRRALDGELGGGNADSATNGEEAVIACASRRLATGGATIFDVGANRGDWTRAFISALANPEACFHALEPSGDTFSVLEIALKADSRVALHRVGLGDEAGELELQIYDRAAGGNSLFEREGTRLEVTDREAVAIETGDEFCRKGAIESIDFLKLDTEGYEMRVLAGLNTMLSAGKVRCLQFEYGGTWIDARSFLKDAFALLVPLGFAIGKIHPAGVRILKEYRQEYDDFRYANFLAMQPEWVSVFPQVK